MQKFRNLMIMVGIALMASLTTQAQDIIVTIDGEKITAKVTEVDVDLVKYTPYDDQEGPTYTVKKSEIDSIIYQNGEVDVFEQNQEKVEGNDEGFALLYIYRPARMMGSMIGYNIHLGEEVICKAKDKWKTTIQVRNFGQHTVWAKTESKEEVVVNFEPGQEYYIRCSLKMGAFVGRPKLELVDKSIGKSEFDAIK